MIEVTRGLWLRRILKDLSAKFDVQIAIVGDFGNRRGLLGLAKTDFAIRLAYEIAFAANQLADFYGWPASFEFDMVRDLVIRDDLRHFKQALLEQRFGKIKVYDEAEWFVFNQFHAFREVRILSPLLDSNRREGGISIWVLPNIFDTVGKLKEERIQWLFVKRSRSTAELFWRNGVCDERKHLWGQSIAFFRDIREIPATVRAEYDELYREHMDLPCPEDKTCVASLRARG